jgi:hypothetical protein
MFTELLKYSIEAKDKSEIIQRVMFKEYANAFFNKLK